MEIKNLDDKLYWYKATVLEVIDGDTLKLDIDLGMNIILKSRNYRLCFVDTPEIKGFEREDGLKVKMFLEDWINPGDPVLIRIYQIKDPVYGEYIADMYILELDNHYVSVKELVVEFMDMNDIKYKNF